jgi:salicylate hydroxylase
MPLNVIVVGAGLGGLGAAIALSRQGHNITVSHFVRWMKRLSNMKPIRSLKSPVF